MAKSNYRRVIVKLSGEALSGPEKFGIHQPTIDRFAADLIAARALGVGLGVVVGGGNVLRGAQISENGLSRPTADAMGMLATVMNALVLEAAIERSGVSARARCAISTRSASSCSPAAPEIPTSPPIPRPSCAQPRWAAAPSSRPPTWMGFIPPIRRRTRRPSAMIT